MLTELLTTSEIVSAQPLENCRPLVKLTWFGTGLCKLFSLHGTHMENDREWNCTARGTQAQMQHVIFSVCDEQVVIETCYSTMFWMLTGLRSLLTYPTLLVNSTSQKQKSK